MVKKWDKKKLIKQLQWFASQKGKLLSMNLFELYSTLDEHVQDIFGSWGTAAKEAEIDPAIFEKIRGAIEQIWVPKVTETEKTWQKEEIIDTIKTLSSLQDSLPTNTILKIITSIEKPATQIFGSWEKAIKTAGLSMHALPDVAQLRHTLDLLKQSSMLDSLLPSKSKEKASESTDSGKISNDEGIQCPKCGRYSTFSDSRYCGICATPLQS